MKYPQAILELIECFQMYPGVGPKSAERMALFTALKLQSNDIKNFSNKLVNLIDKINFCRNCGTLTDQDLCEICTDNNRNDTILVVENTKDVISIEKTNQYNGKYHVLNGVISPLNGIGPEDINLNSLFSRIEKEKIKEIIIATSATIEGETTALYIKKMLEKHNIEVSRIGYGLPAGGDIEYADEITLIKSLEGRRKM